jgi:hypothetical protein
VSELSAKAKEAESLRVELAAARSAAGAEAAAVMQQVSVTRGGPVLIETATGEKYTSKGSELL